MNSITLFINSSSWQSLTIGHYQFFSPNMQLIEHIKINPDSEFWHTTYTEFACVIIDNSNHIITCVRDHCGLEPFFYYLSDQQFIFGSNLPDIINSLGYTPEINEAQIIMLLLNTCIPAAYYSDETNFKSIYRVEPGCKLNIKNNQIDKIKYWQLNSLKEPIIYTNNADYIEHFSALLSEGIKLQLHGNDTCAAEFSGGLDSTTVITGLKQYGIEPDLFMHIAPENSDEIDDSSYAAEVIHQYKLSKVHQIDAKNFDLIETIHQCAKLFAGSPHYIFPICANNIHQAVAKSGHKILFSGFGGDECVSGHAPLYICLREYLQEGNYNQAWSELNAYYTNNNLNMPSPLRKLLTLIKGLFPHIFEKLNQLTTIICNQQNQWHSIPLTLPQSSTIREHEYNLLQGMYSQHVRLRVEESAILAKHMGFNYKYPLLYPKLIEYCYQLPINLKRDNGENRLLVRNYLAQYLPPSVYQKHQKRGGIMPATMNKVKQENLSGKYNNTFISLPFNEYAKQLQQKYPDKEQSKLLQQILLYGFKMFMLHSENP